MARAYGSGEGGAVRSLALAVVVGIAGRCCSNHIHSSLRLEFRNMIEDTHVKGRWPSVRTDTDVVGNVKRFSASQRKSVMVERNCVSAY